MRCLPSFRDSPQYCKRTTTEKMKQTKKYPCIICISCISFVYVSSLLDGLMEFMIYMYMSTLQQLLATPLPRKHFQPRWLSHLVPRLSSAWVVAPDLQPRQDNAPTSRRPARMAVLSVDFRPSIVASNPILAHPDTVHRTIQVREREIIKYNYIETYLLGGR